MHILKVSTLLVKRYCKENLETFKIVAEFFDRNTELSNTKLRVTIVIKSLCVNVECGGDVLGRHEKIWGRDAFEHYTMVKN